MVGKTEIASSWPRKGGLTTPWNLVATRWALELERAAQA